MPQTDKQRFLKDVSNILIDASINELDYRKTAQKIWSYIYGRK